LKTLIIAEKPSVARDIAKVLGCTGKGVSFIDGGKYIVTWALGHLVALQDPDKIDEKYKKWRMDDLPILPNKIPLNTIYKTRAQYKAVKELMLSADVQDIICATDAGREGELIFRLIYEHAKCAKPFRRLWISSMTDESIADGFQKLKDGTAYDSLYYSSICRAYADWYIGMNASRLYSINYHAVLSIGRVQTPTLALIVRKQKEIDEFVPIEYYTIHANFGDFTAFWFNINNQNTKTNKQISSRQRAEEIVKECKGQTASILSNDTTRNQELPPQLYDLTTLQREANDRLGFTAEKTLKIAQELYEKHKVLTYPRTDSRCLSEDIRPKIPALLNALTQDFPEYANAAKSSIEKINNKRIFNNEKVSDHHAIIPTGKRISWDTMDDDTVNLLKLVLARFLAIFFPPYVTDTQKIIAKINSHHFICQGKRVAELGWKELDKLVPNKRKSKKEEEAALPELYVGDTRKLINAKIKEDKTKPPEQYTDSSLLSAMESAGRLLDDTALKNAMKANGLGTPATRAAIIERLIKVGYLKRVRKYFQPTEKGIKLISIIPDTLSSPELTGEWELKLNQIASSKEEARALSLEFLNGIRRFAGELVQNGKTSKADVIFEKENNHSKKKRPDALGTCPLCKQGEVLENSKGYYCSRWREQCKFTIWKNTLERSGGPAISASIMKSLLEVPLLEGSSGSIQLIDGKLSFSKNRINQI